MGDAPKEVDGVAARPAAIPAAPAPAPDWAELLAAPVGPDDERFFADYPPAWHEGPSIASRILQPLGVSAAKYVRADAGVRGRLLDQLAGRAARVLLGRTFVCAAVALAILVTMSGALRGFALAGCAIKAGADLANYFGRRRTLGEAFGLTEADLELTEPKDDA